VKPEASETDKNTMKFQLLWLPVLSLVLATCTTPPQPPANRPNVGVDDDHRLVSPEEFQTSAWKALPAEVSWRPLPNGAAVTLADGR